MSVINTETETVEKITTSMNKQSHLLHESVELLFNQGKLSTWVCGSGEEFVMRLADCCQCQCITTNKYRNSS